MAATVTVYLLPFPMTTLFGDENAIGLGEGKAAQAVKDVVEFNPSFGHHRALLAPGSGTLPGLGSRAN